MIMSKHGRLIDADAFAEFIADTSQRQKYEDLKVDGLLTVADVLDAVISELKGTGIEGLKNAPTIEPEWKNRLVKEIKDKTPEETYDFLSWLMVDYGLQFTHTRQAVIEWLRGEK